MGPVDTQPRDGVRVLGGGEGRVVCREGGKREGGGRGEGGREGGRREAGRREGGGREEGGGEDGGREAGRREEGGGGERKVVRERYMYMYNAHVYIVYADTQI